MRTGMLIPLFNAAGATGDEDLVLEGRELFDQGFAHRADSHNHLAWRLGALVKGVDPLTMELSPAGANLLLDLSLELAHRAVELEPDDPNLWNSLGVVRYWVGDFEGAIEALTQMELDVSASAMTWLPLALCHHGLGDESAAWQWYVRAVSWLAANADESRDTQWFLAEATRVLGVE